MQPDASSDPGRRRVRITKPDDSRFHGMEGRVIVTHSRLPCSRVELDRLPIDCTSRTFWFNHDRLEWL